MLRRDVDMILKRPAGGTDREAGRDLRERPPESDEEKVAGDVWLAYNERVPCFRLPKNSRRMFKE
jgi:hypothetical protein